MFRTLVLGSDAIAGFAPYIWKYDPDVGIVRLANTPSPRRRVGNTLDEPSHRHIAALDI